MFFRDYLRNERLNSNFFIKFFFVIIVLLSIFLIFTELGNNVHALHVKVAFFHTLVIHACVLYSTRRLRTADLREMKAYTSIAPFQSTADS